MEDIDMETSNQVTDAGSSTGQRTVSDQATMFTAEAPPEAELPGTPEALEATWLDELRERIKLEQGRYLAIQDGPVVSVLPLDREWTRIGRTASADIQLDDHSVSRRHAIVVAKNGQLRLLDDRSVNGVYVNGERIDWCGLVDGDEIAVGRYKLHYIDTEPSSSSR
jgi:pSer/pThr/pTyr-binding forkhead associated (FHA) protein